MWDMGSLVKKSSISSDGVRRRNSSNASTKEEGEEEQVLCSTFSANNSAGQDESLATTDANINSNIAGRCSGIACRCAMLVCLFAGMQYSFNQAVLYRQEQDSIPPGVLRLQRMQRQNKIPHAADVLANNPVHLRFADISQKNAEAMKQLNAQLGQVFNENHTITLADLTDLDRKESLKDVTWEEAALDRGPILDTLHRAGLKVDVQVLQRLPTWSQVVNLYGSKPVIVGRDTVCQAFRDQVPAATRFVGVAGQMNTGTNAMAKYLAQNIQILENEIGYGVLWTVPWYKHAWASLRFRYQYRIPKEHANVLAVVIIRDPYFWMQSMCESPYTLEWNKSDSHCPNLVEKGLSGVPVTIRWSTNFVRKWPSLAHLWSSWYREYIDADDMPRIVVRFEDLLFHTEAVVEEIRDCVGASYVDKEHFHYAAAPAKTHPYFSKYKAPSSLISAMIKYGQDDNGSSRTGNMNEADLAYASKNLDADLIQQFQYQRQPGSNK